MCKRIMKAETSENGEIPFYKIGTFGGTPDVFISKETFEEYKNKYSYPKIGDILISAAGTIGRSVIYNGEDAYYQDSNIVWIDNDETKVLNSYLFYLYKNIRWKVSTGSTILRLYNDNIRETEIVVPSIEEQRNISGYLSLIDYKISLNTRMNAELEAMAKQLYDYWFVQFDFPDENGNPYKSSGGKMVYSPTFKREIPEGWEAKPLKELLILEDSRRIPLSNKERENRKGIFPYYGATGIMDYIDDYFFDGDFLLLAEDGSTSDENGNPVVQYIWGKNWVNNHAHIIHVNNVSSLQYYYFLLKTIPVVLIETGSIQKKISQENLLSYSVICPPDYIISNYCRISSSYREVQKKTIDEINYLTHLRDSLLPMLMNGQVTVE